MRRLVGLLLLFDGKSGRTVGQGAADVRDVRRVSGEAAATASHPPVLLLPRQRVWGGGAAAERPPHWLHPSVSLTNRLLRSWQPRSDRRGGFTYSKEMEMTQTRGHEDPFHFSSWAISQVSAGLVSSQAFFIIIIWMKTTAMSDSRHVGKVTGSTSVLAFRKPIHQIHLHLQYRFVKVIYCLSFKAIF